MFNKRIGSLTAFLAAMALVLAACGGPAASATPFPTEQLATEAGTEPSTVTEAATEAATTEATTEATTAATTEATSAATEPATGTQTTGAGNIDCKGAAAGDTVSMLYQWAGTEEASFNQVMQPLLDACGITLQPESTRDQALLDTRVQGGNPPDIAFWNVTQLTQYQDDLMALDELGATMANYEEFFTGPGVINNRWLGLPVKADVKTIIWYSPSVFEANGYAVPTTWEELDALVEQMVADGNVPWSMGFESGDATGWAGSDFIQDILLVQQGPDYVNGLIDGSIPYNDEGVMQAYETYGKWATDPKYTVGGAQGTLSTPFLEAIYAPFSDPPAAMMVKQSGFAGAEIAKQFPELEQGTDYDFFVIPDAQGLQGGADWLMAFSDSPAVQAVVTYLSSEMGGQAWAEANFGLSPNMAAAGHYSDPGLTKLDEALGNATGFTPDLGDTIPGGFGAAEWNAIVSYVNGQELAPLLDQVAQVQADALAGAAAATPAP
jgi:alpha-glucoside transport system substrate-binding protein